MFAWFERRIDPFRPAPVTQPPTGLTRFYWHFVRQVWPAFLVLMTTGGLVALLEVAMFRYIGQIIDLLKTTEPARFFAEQGTNLLVMAVVVLVLRPVLGIVHDMLVRQTVIP
ncbi:MAG: hypothetical protein AB7O80_26730, partial [Acetobacteraceae bacterium]